MVRTEGNPHRALCLHSWRFSPCSHATLERARRLPTGRAARRGGARAREEAARAAGEVEHADDRYSNLEIGIGALQIAIVLASLSIVAAATWLLGGGVLAGVIGLAYVAYATAVT